MKLLITGCAGFIGFHLALLRLKQGDEVIGIDNLNDYYDVSLKKDRLHQLKSYENFQFYQTDIADLDALTRIFESQRPQRVVNLAAQAGVRYSIENPHAYVQSNLVGFTNVIELCRNTSVEHLVYASTSSVYGANKQIPYQEDHSTNHPLAIYAATKKSNELIAHSYAHLFKLPVTGLRCFTVYGTCGRPDMAFFSFTKDILEENPIKVFNYGEMKRDFTYIDDIVEGISLAVDKPAEPCQNWDPYNPLPSTSDAPYRVYNIGNGSPVNLLDYIEAIEKATGKKAIKEFLPMQPGDVYATHADTTRLERDLGYVPKTNIQAGVEKFVQWYLDYYDKA